MRLRAEILDLGNGQSSKLHGQFSILVTIKKKKNVAILVGKQSRPFCTLTAVCAPELIFEVVTHSVKPPPTPASDIWSFACTVRGWAVLALFFFVVLESLGLILHD
jgi:hypothetical protein